MPLSLSRPKPGFAQILAALVSFGASFGFVEAAVVVYLRAIYAPIHQQVYPDAEPDSLFPTLLPEDLDGVAMRLMVIELVREAATLVMLAAVALAVARNMRQWLAAFLIAFGVWDILFYVSLKVLIDWPPSLWTWDLLFLLPVPWVGPVLAPVIVALTMIGSGGIVLWREVNGRPLPLRAGHWLAIVAGGLLLVLAFCWDWSNITNRGEPGRFQWPLFAIGEGFGLVGLLHALRPCRESKSGRAHS